ncbi:MAG: glycoside hydrolase family 92 protein [Ruminococcaceae bacterium]|nr:glycoside hydrolase family 92 protein [Oscillospiraceae bacterium]
MEFINFVDTLFGVGSSTSAGPTLPSGSVHPSPETLDKDCGGYYRNQPIIGFGQAYTSGAGGTKCYGNFLLSPMLEKVELDAQKTASFAVKEEGRCYEYRVELENGIKIRTTPEHNSAIYSFDFPKGKEAYLLIDAAHKLDIDASMKRGSVSIDYANNVIFGGGRFYGNWNFKEWDMFFALSFDTPFKEIGVFEGEKLNEINKSTSVFIDEEKRLGAYIGFGKTERPVKVKIAISFVSTQKAKEFLEEQIVGFDYEKVKENAKEKWREALSVIKIKTEDKDLLTRFYTAMYHVNIQPRNRVSDHGNWDDFHTIWDTWKTAFPLRSLIYPEKMGQIIDSMLDRAEYNEKAQNGIVLAESFLAGKETPVGQGGNDVENVIVDAFLKNVPLEKHTWQEAYNVVLKSAEEMRSYEYINNGYSSKNNKTVSGVEYTWRFKPAATTLGFALNDKAVSNMAEKIGTEEEYEKYLKRSKNWLNVWNKDVKSEGFSGFPQTRNEDGTFDPDFDAHGGYNTHFYEATGWDASYINYNDLDLLVETMGGAEIFKDRLLWACEHSVNYYNDDHGKEGYLNFTNEPSFHIPWLFCTDSIKRPDLAAKVIDGVIERFSKLYDYPGDEDNGGMASFYIFLMSGFFPFATTENYYLHGTRIEEIVFSMKGGKELRITGENVGKENIYVQSAFWQGKELNVCRLTHSQIMEGGELHFVMGNTPSDWATK